MKAIKNKDKDCHNRTTRVGIKEIAAEAGVSPTTVSNVALGKTERISEKTVQRVQRLLEEKKYVPSMGNRLLSGKYSCVVGKNYIPQSIVTPVGLHTFHSKILKMQKQEKLRCGSGK